ncbi:type I polyketide synthase [Nocardia sp. BMG51109]|uniref:type I polyketide synthase n=1 Tax=Nocardia sp. BMG51109 TaxID=1056816 RepID=UPI0004BCA187
MTIDDSVTPGVRHAYDDGARGAGIPLIERLRAGHGYALAFGGQGVSWLEPCAEICDDHDLTGEIAEVVRHAADVLAPIAGQLLVAAPAGFDPVAWFRASDDLAGGSVGRPSVSVLRSPAVSVPGILLSQIAGLRALARHGLDLARTPPVSLAGHSQGVLGVAAAADRGADPRLLAIARLIGAAGARAGRRLGLVVLGERTPMVAVSHADPDELRAVVAEVAEGLDPVAAPVVSIRNGRRHAVLSGPPEQLERVEERYTRRTAERVARGPGGVGRAPEFERLPIDLAFHHPALGEAVELAAGWAEQCALDVALTRTLARQILVDPVDWPAAVAGVPEAGARWVLDVGPGDLLTRLTAPSLRGSGIGIVPALTRAGQRSLLTPGAAPAISPSWSEFSPRPVALPDGRVVTETAFTRLTGRSPILLAGMTPTTVDAGIVAAAANAGHWAELAGGGQVTGAVFADSVARLRSLLEPGRAVQFNALFLDPYLWSLQLGGKRLVQQARAGGAPLDGVVISAGIPELDAAVALVEELTEAGIPYVAFKPGTVAQIRQVARIAVEMPGQPIIVHIEGGRAGGHHSWEELDELLLETYAELRLHPGVVICAGGGIGTPARAADYLTGAWSRPYGRPPMPVDGVLVGTAAMATAEATTSPQVKRLLVETPGTPDWVSAGASRGGITSGRSHLGADIHEIDNSAARTGRLLDEVAGDAAAVEARRDEIIAALNRTAKPYFGDLSAMTYAAWLRRYVELAAGVTGPPWPDVSWRDRFTAMAHRTEARLHPADRGPIPSLFADPTLFDRPGDAVTALIGAYPDAETTVLHPADAHFFVALCRTPGKPVNFVPVLDSEVRRWWRSDSLWQAHDPRYAADAVCVIPGPVSVAGITRVDEPVGELLDRFERAATDAVLATGARPLAVAARRRSGEAGATTDVVLGAPDLSWAGRLVPNPVRRLGAPDAWTPGRGGSRSHPPTGATLREISSERVELEVPLTPGARLRIGIGVPPSARAGGAPVVTAADAEAAMTGLLEVAAGGPVPQVRMSDGRWVAHLDLAWTPDVLADHAGVLDTGFPDAVAVAGGTAPDVLVGACWPAVFAVLGAVRGPGPAAAVEGLLDLVHLDHQVRLSGEWPSATSVLTVRAESGDVVDTESGRVIEVHVRVGAILDDVGTGLENPVLATLTERFAIRGRTGPGAPADPPQAAGTRTTVTRDTPRRRRRDLRVVAPASMAAFAELSGDHNPIHTSAAAAALAGLDDVIVHGMWLSAAGQYAAGGAGRPAARAVTAWTARFLGMVRPGDTIDIRVDRIAADAGAEIVEVSCRVGDEPVMLATGRLAPPPTVYAFPGQGIQRQGMGLDAMARSRAAGDVWQRADAHTRRVLGFSILAVVRDNPAAVRAGGIEYRHPDGVLHLTQFTQAALATLGVAQAAELRESGVFVEGAVFAGHSLGEYVALAAVAEVIPLETLLEIVFQRGQAMDQLVPRDADGHSEYGMAAIRPAAIGLTDRDVVAFVAGVAQRAGEFLEVVNLNLRDAQYSVAGTEAGLHALAAEIDARRGGSGGERAFVRIPGVDVPFHSRVLRAGVAEFRAKLDELLPATIRPEVLVGRYIPNLIPAPFTLEREFLSAITDLVPSEPLAAVLDDYDEWAARPAQLCRIVLIELLAWQFASPVRWIETQDLLFTDEGRGGLGMRRFVEVGLAAAPTLANLAARTLRLPGFGVVEVLNAERDAAVVLGTDADPVDTESPDTESLQIEQPQIEQPAADVPPVPDASADVVRPEDIPFTAADATTVLIALWTKLRPDQIGPADTVEGLCDGVSSRRNQLLVDLSAELSVGAIDGAAEADTASLAVTVRKLARTYRPFGSVLTEWLNDHLRRVLGPSGRRPAAIGDRLRTVWGLGDGWTGHVTAELALGTREGTSVRGGELGGLVPGPLGDGAAVDAAVDAAVRAVATRHGVAVSLLATGGAAGASVDPAAIGEFAERITGRDGVLAAAARLVLDQLGLAEPSRLESAPDTGVLDAVSAELGPDWPRLVEPAFDADRAVCLDDRWAGAREDLARVWSSGVMLDPAGFAGTGESVAAQAQWWRDRASAAGRDELASAYVRIARAARSAEPGEFAADIAVVTGASKGSIAAALAGGLLAGGATVIATTSRLDDERLAFYRELYRDHARGGAALWVVPANLASYRDVDALIEWIANPRVRSAGGTSQVIKPAWTPTLLLPFAAPRVSGDLSEAGARAETEMRLLLWTVERLVGGLSRIGADRDVDAKLHVLLPGSPNRGVFGGDGAYGESKAALDAVVAKWRSERTWSRRVTLVHALIGWVRGTGLMSHNDPLAAAVEDLGVRTWSAEEMAAELLAHCSAEARTAAATGPRHVDLTGGLAGVELDLSALATAATGDTRPGADREPEPVVAALPSPPVAGPTPRIAEWGTVTTDLADMVVIVGAGELGPYGSARTRFEMEVSDRLSAAGVLELAWTTGLVTWENDPAPGWYDTDTGDPVPEAEIAERYHDAVLARTGIRSYADDGVLAGDTVPLLASVFLERDMTFTVGSESEARAFAAADGANTVIAPVPDSRDWTVIRKAGTEIRVPRRAEMTRTVGGQIPSGFDPRRWGIPPDMASALDRLAVWNIVTAVDAFVGAGFAPDELMRWVHPAAVANTMGTGLGALAAMRSSYLDRLLGEERPNDILQETLLNVTAAHVVQSYIGSYGAMVHPVGACATAAVSVAEGADKIRFRRADFVVAGGIDDLSAESVGGFADMSATADSTALAASGIAERRFSRPNDRRRAGFVESQGGGTVLLTRGDLALELGLPVLGVVAYADSFGDGVQTSIPAPGLGALAAGRGGEESEVAANLRGLGVTPDDIAVVSKHDTSTAANDPNESDLHERLATALGRTEGNPLFVVSQKSLTGHAKGGAAAFQLIGLCQVLTTGVVTPNRSLDCVDDALAAHGRLVWVREPLEFGESLPLRAGLLTSLGFGHISCLIALVHPEAFLRAVPGERIEEYLSRSQARLLAGRRRLADAMCGGAPLYRRPTGRLGPEGTSAADIRSGEAATLLSRDARLTADGVYRP